MYVVYDLGTEGIPRYSWNTAKVGVKHQSINGTRSTHVGMVWINRMYSIYILVDEANDMQYLPTSETPNQGHDPHS
jgi:hypothetical protein